MRPTGLPCSCFIVLLVAQLVQAPLQAQAQVTHSVPPSTPAATPPVTATATNTLVNSLTQAVVQQGALNCVSRVNQVSNFLGFGPQAGAVLMLPNGQPDQHLLPISMEIPTQGTSAYVSATFAPNQANGCGAVYESVMYWAQNCGALAANQFANLKRIGQIKTSVTVLDGGAAMKVFLLPAGNGCLAIKKEVVL